MTVVRFPTERTRQTVGSATRRLDVAVQRNRAWTDKHRDEFVRLAQEAAAAHEEQQRAR